MRKAIVFKYINFYFHAKNTKGRNVHEPYIYNILKAIYHKKSDTFATIEQCRYEMKHNNTELNIVDFGTGSTRKQIVKSIANRALKSAKFGQMMYRILLTSKAEHILELGTSLGITTAYIASVSKNNRCVTMEGCPDIATQAKKNLDKLGLNNVEIVVGNINNNLDETLQTFKQIDFAFIDANHRYEAVIEYFEKIITKLSSEAIIVIDDIYWSEGMERAWEEIKNHPTVTSTIDFFQLGIVFFKKDLNNIEYKALY